MNVSSSTLNFVRILKSGIKEDILRKLQEEKEIDLTRIKKRGKTVFTLTFENENLTEEDVIDILEHFLDRGVDPYIKDKFGKTALLEAATRSMKGVVDLLIRRQVNVNRTYSSTYRDGDITHRLVEDWSKFNCAFRRLSDAKAKTIAKKSASLVEWLITKGFDFERRNKYGVSALSKSLDYGLQHIALAILEHTEQINVTYNANRNLLHKFFSPFGTRERHNFSSRYASKIVEILLDKGLSAVDFSDDLTTPLRLAVAREQALNIIEMLLDRLVWSKDVATTVLIELFHGCIGLIESKTVHILKIARTLIAEGADVNGKDPSGKTAVYYAFQGRNRRAIDLLDENGADFSLHYGSHGTLFHALAGYGNPCNAGQQEALFDLLASKACCDVNATDSDARTPLHYAAEPANLTIARKLIQHGADVNAKDSDGSTALHLAVGSCARDRGGKLVELLLTSGANVNCKNRSGHRPLACVKKYTSRQSISLLLKWGALVYDEQNGEFIFCRVFWTKGFECAMEMLAYGLDINDRRISNYFISPLVYDSEIWSRFGSHLQMSLEEKFLPRHCIKLVIAKLPCLDRYKCYLNYIVTDREYEECCLREVAKLKSTFIDSQTSLYDYLHMDFESRFIYIHNEKLQNLVDQPEQLQQQFAEYSVLILARYRTAVRWKSLLEPAKEAWLRLTHVALPDICIERIFAHLRIEDLVVFIEDV